MEVEASSTITDVVDDVGDGWGLGHVWLASRRWWTLLRSTSSPWGATFLEFVGRPPPVELGSSSAAMAVQASNIALCYFIHDPSNREASAYHIGNVK
jgi:hypothetical protein